MIFAVIRSPFRKAFVIRAGFSRGTSDILPRIWKPGPFFFCKCARFPIVRRDRTYRHAVRAGTLYVRHMHTDVICTCHARPQTYFWHVFRSPNTASEHIVAYCGIAGSPFSKFSWQMIKCILSFPKRYKLLLKILCSLRNSFCRNSFAIS